MKTMEWEERVWLGLKDAVSEMPPFVRGKALKKIIAAAETEARGRQSELVEAPDLWAAVEIAVPALIKPMCRNALKGAGL